MIIVISAIFVNNVVLSQFLGICPFLGVSNRVNTSLGMGAAVTFVMTISSIVTYLLQRFVLGSIEYMQTIVFILVIAALVQMVEIILKKVSPSLYQALGIFLPLITTNCAVLGIAILAVQKEYNLGQSVVFSAATAIGFSLALVLFAGLRETVYFITIGIHDFFPIYSERTVGYIGSIEQLRHTQRVGIELHAVCGIDIAGRGNGCHSIGITSERPKVRKAIFLHRTHRFIGI